MSPIPKIALYKEGLLCLSKKNEHYFVCFSGCQRHRKWRNMNTSCKTNHLFPCKKPHRSVMISKYLLNMSLHFFVSDLEDAGPTRNAPCNPETKCKNAYKQNLAGCEAATGRCICSRGYVMSEGICTGRICNSSSSPLHLSYSIYPT